MSDRAMDCALSPVFIVFILGLGCYAGDNISCAELGV